MTDASALDLLPTLLVRPEEAKRAPIRINLSLDEKECAALAAIHGLEGISSFVLKAEVRAHGKRALKADGNLIADVTYKCGVTLEPYSVALHVPLKQMFVAKLDDRDGDAITIDPLDEYDVDGLRDGEADIADAAYQLFATSLDPFPRHPSLADAPADANDSYDGEADENPVSPFAVLAQLKPQ
ncbi:MAG: DUF177 domain-containing protein [Pseudomonadota bacterium]